MRIYVAGHTGMLGSALVRALTARGYDDIYTRDHDASDLCDWMDVSTSFDNEVNFRNHPFDYVFMAAGRVGGIKANSEDPAVFLQENTLMALNIIDACKEYRARLCYVGSSCIYPRECPQPMKEEYLLTGALEPTNEGYALAKIVGLKYAQYLLPDSVQPMPCNLYGTNDHYGENGHVLPSLIRRFVDAVDNGLPAVRLWGTGSARREFLHVDDCAAALVFLMERGERGMVNIGSGEEVTIKELAPLIANEAGYNGAIEWDATMPDGMPRKLLNTNRINALGWYPSISLRDGIQRTIAEYRQIKEQLHA